MPVLQERAIRTAPSQMIKLTQEREIAPSSGCIRTMIDEAEK